MGKIFHRFFAAVLVTGSILLLADSMLACTCIGDYTLDWSTKASENILLLKLKAVEKYKNGEVQYTTDGIKQSKLIVQKAFKGSIKIGEEVTFQQGEKVDCIWGFSEKEIGTEFLFFLGKNNWFELNSICSRSNSLKFSAADLLYVEKFKKVFGKTRLAGVIYNVTEKKADNPVWNSWNYEPIAGRRVRIIGNGIDITLKANKNGAYEVYDLPLGKYRIIPQKVKGYRTLIPSNETIDEVEIKANSLVEQNIEYLAD